MADSATGPADRRTPAFSVDFPPPDYGDPVIEVYMQHVDRTLLRENLKLSVEERVRKALAVQAAVERWRGAATRPTGKAAQGPS